MADTTRDASDPTYEAANSMYTEQEDSSIQHDLDYSGGDSFDYASEGDVPEDAMYDEDEDDYDLEYEEELSSSPSIPEENINFDLVYALHTFLATVDGQATVQKGDHLVLLDDSNSYWWLVRVMSSQEVGYIPAENIETPYERLARLNKHRNVEITTATEDDNDEPASDGILVKSRASGDVNEQSGKVSALSRRELGTVQMRAQRTPPKKFGVLFGQSQYLEHSGNENTEDEYEYDTLEFDESVDAHEPELDTDAPGSAAAALAPAAEVNQPATARDASLLGLEGLFNSTDESDSQVRPASLLGMPGSEKMFHVVRVFAGDGINSDATFKTVLLTHTTTAQELVKQSMQRFSLQDNDEDFQIVLHHIDGDEKALGPQECPLVLLDELTTLAADDPPTGLPYKHDSVSSLLSLIDTSQSRLMFDYSDDRLGKLFLMRRGPMFDRSESEEAADAPPVAESQWRFTIQMALYHTDLPPGTYFDPDSGEPMRGSLPYSMNEKSRVQKRLLRFTKNATVAEVIEAGLSAFHIMDAVVDGGDDVDARMWHARPRAKYTLTARSIEGEQPLHPTSKVLAAFDTLPQLTPVEPNSKRKSLDSAIAPGSPGDLMHTDPLFILRLVLPEPTMNESVASEAPLDTPRAWQPPLIESAATSSKLIVHPNSHHGVDVLLEDGQRLRSARVLDSPLVRYSFVSSSNHVKDVSDTLPPVLENLTRMHGQTPSSQSDLLQMWATHMSLLSDASVQADMDSIQRFVAQQTDSTPRDPVPENESPVRRSNTSPKAPARERVGGLNLPSQSLQRTSSVRSVSASETAEPRLVTNLPQRIGDRVLSDSTVTTGTDRRGQERYNFHALYGIVDALVLETPSSGLDTLSVSSDAAVTESPQGSLVRASAIMAKLLEDSPAEKLQRDSNGLFALPWPTSDVTSAAAGDVRQNYAPIMAQISALEAALDEQLLRVLAYQVPSRS